MLVAAVSAEVHRAGHVDQSQEVAAALSLRVAVGAVAMLMPVAVGAAPPLVRDRTLNVDLHEVAFDPEQVRWRRYPDRDR
jgi:hypothetical protein